MKRLSAEERETRPIVCVVTEVYPHTEPDDDSNVEVDVQLRDGSKSMPRVSVLPARNGHIDVPEVGEQVKIDYLAGPNKIPVVTERSYSPSTRAPLAQAGHWRHEFARDASESLYVEAEPADHSAGDPEVLRMGIKPDGLSDATTAVEIDRSTSPPSVRIRSETANVDVETDQGDVSLVASNGTVTIDASTITATDGSTTIDLLNHTHEYTDDTTEGSSTKTTNGPK